MQTALRTGLLAISLSFPVAAYAQPAKTVPIPATDTTIVIQPMQWVTIGVGVVVGAAVLDMVMPTGIAFVVGGSLGGYLANAWYNGYGVEVRVAPKT
jgi:homoserine acetyltransferase